MPAGLERDVHWEASTSGLGRPAPWSCVPARARLRSMAVLAGRRWVRVVAWSLTGLTLLTLFAALVLLGLDARVMDSGRVAFYVVCALAVAVYAGIGRLIATRLPGNAIGWLLGLIGLSLAASLFTEQYALRGLAVAAGSLPAVRQVGALSEVMLVLVLCQLVFVVLLFPDGRLPSRRWRPVLWGAYVALAGAVAQRLQGGTIEGLTNALLGARVAYPNPLGVFPRHGVFSGVFDVMSRLLWPPPCWRSPRCSCGGAARVPSSASSWPGSATSAC